MSTLTAKLVGRLEKSARHPSAVQLPTSGRIGVVAHGSYYLVGLNPTPGSVRPIKRADLDRDSASLGHDKSDNSVILYGGRPIGARDGDGTLSDCARINADTGEMMVKPTFSLPINLAECAVVEHGDIDLIVGGFDANEAPRRFVSTQRRGVFTRKPDMVVGCAGNAVRIGGRVYIGFDSFLPESGPIGMPFVERAESAAGGLASGAEQFPPIRHRGFLRIAVAQKEGNTGFFRLGDGAGSGDATLSLIEASGVTTLGAVQVDANEVDYKDGGTIPFAISNCPLIDRTRDHGYIYAIAPTITVFFPSGGMNSWPTSGIFAIKVD